MTGKVYETVADSCGSKCGNVCCTRNCQGNGWSG